MGSIVTELHVPSAENVSASMAGCVLRTLANDEYCLEAPRPQIRSSRNSAELIANAAIAPSEAAIMAK